MSSIYDPTATIPKTCTSCYFTYVLVNNACYNPITDCFQHGYDKLNNKVIC